MLGGVKSTYLSISHFQIILDNEIFVYNLEKKIATIVPCYLEGGCNQAVRW